MKHHNLDPLPTPGAPRVALVCLLAMAAAGPARGADWVWSRVMAGGTKPAGREGHATVEVGNRLYVIGGCLMDIKCFNDVQMFDTETLTWSQLGVQGDAPEPRGGHSATLVGTDIYVFGGASSEATYDDVFKLDLVGLRWTRATVAAGAHKPARRTNHAAAADKEGRVYIFGGYDAEGNYLNDMWILNVYWNGHWVDPSSVPVSWEAPVPVGIPPNAREGHSMTLVQGKLFVIGGYTALGKTTNDVHAYDIEGQAWVAVSVVPGLIPPPRQSHSASRHGLQIVIAGGCDVSPSSQICYNDVWSLDTTGMRWTPKSKDMVTLFAREGHTSSFVRGRMFVFGGCQLTAECYNDVAVLDTADPCPATCGGHGQCKDWQFCQCFPGFTGHDCLQPQSCPFDCSGRGQCLASGACACQNGFTGPSCEKELPCPGAPLKCLGRGLCLADGTCQCQAGFFGVDCSGGAAAPVPTTPAPQLVLAAAASAPPMAAPVAAQVQVAASVVEHNACPQNCCGHGSCSLDKKGGNRTCACASGWHGPACSFDDASWAMVFRYNKRRGAELSEQAQEKRQQAERTKLLASMMEETAAQKGSAGGAVLAQLQQLKKDVTELSAEADELDGRSAKLQATGEGDLLRELQSLTSADATTCTPLPGGLLMFAKMLKDGERAPGTSSATSQVAKTPAAGSGKASKRSNVSFAFVKADVSMPVTGSVEPVIEDFGIPTKNKKGITGIMDQECKENCNFRGVCSEGTCYCQPGYYGETCGTLKEKKAGSIPLGLVVLISAGCVAISFIFTLCFLTVTERQKRRKEKDMGYAV